MKQLYGPGDFEAIIRLYSAAEGGRSGPAYNGIRWDFMYADNPPENNYFMIWPDFYDENGDSLPTDQPLPVGVELPARMIIGFGEMKFGNRRKTHRGFLYVGIRFYCMEGLHRVAEGWVTRITGLFEKT